MEIWFYLGLFLLGTMDALQPGHAKALVSSVLAGSNAKLRHVILLGLTVTLVHIAVNGLLAYGISMLAMAIFHKELIRYIELFAGVAIIILALTLLWQRFIHVKKSPACATACHHHLPVNATGLTPWQIIVLGVISGLTPCPVVLTALVSAIALGKGVSAMIGISVFSLGMGAVIMLVGLLTLYGVERLRWFQQPQNALRLSRWSAVAVLFLGVLLVVRTLYFPESEAAEPSIQLVITSHR